MRLIVRLIVYAMLAPVLVIGLVIGDVAFNGRRLLYVALGGEALIEACRPVLKSHLDAAGFEPAAIEFGEAPDITFSTAAGKTLTDTFTFQDGAAQARIDGLVVCAVKGGTVEVEMRMRATPLRAT